MSSKKIFHVSRKNAEELPDFKEVLQVLGETKKICPQSKRYFYQKYSGKIMLYYGYYLMHLCDKFVMYTPYASVWIWDDEKGDQKVDNGEEVNLLPLPTLCKEQKYLAVPISVSVTSDAAHVVLLFIDTQKKEIEYYDSLGYPMEKRKNAAITCFATVTLGDLLKAVQQQYSDYLLIDALSKDQHDLRNCMLYVLYRVGKKVEMITEKNIFPSLRESGLSTSYFDNVFRPEIKKHLEETEEILTKYYQRIRTLPIHNYFYPQEYPLFSSIFKDTK